MPDELTRDGLTVKTLPEIEEQLKAGLESAYDEEIDFADESPDNLMVKIVAQAAVDHRELIKKVYNSLSVTTAQGRVLDERVALMGVKRKGASFTYVAVDVEVDREVQLQGLDLRKGELTPSVPNLFTVKDDTGTEYYLMDSATIKPKEIKQEVPTESALNSEEAEEPTTTPQTREEWEAARKAAREDYNAAIKTFNADVVRVTSIQDWFKEGPNKESLPDLPIEPEILSQTYPGDLATTPTPTSGTETPETPLTEETTSFAFLFRAAKIGAIETLPGTIKTPVNIIAGVVSVDNSSRASVTGVDEETDERLKARFYNSSSLPAQGYVGTIESQIQALPKVDIARVYENYTDTTNNDGQSAHSIWVIVKGAPESGVEDSEPGTETLRESIAQVLYRARTAGCDMFTIDTAPVGDQTLNIRETEKIIMPNGQYFHAYWNQAVEKAIFLKITVGHRDEYNTEDTSKSFSIENINKLVHSLLGKSGGKKLQWGLGLNASPSDVHRFISNKHTDYNVFTVEFSTDLGETKNWSPDLVQPKKYETLVFTRAGSIINTKPLPDVGELSEDENGNGGE